MSEHEMEDLIWDHPELFLNEPLKQVRRQPSSVVGRADLIFEDRLGRLLVIEVKYGKLGRGAIDQLHDYYGMVKREFPDKVVELMVIAHSIPDERRLACDKYDIEARAISERTFRDVAARVGYVFRSEVSPLEKDTASESRKTESRRDVGNSSRAWSFSGSSGSNAARVPAREATDFLERCDDTGRLFFSAFFEMQKKLAGKTKITWNHESGFSMHFYFPRLGFVQMVWGFPKFNQARKQSNRSQSLVFPFDSASKAGAPHEFLNGFGEAISQIVYLPSGRSRPSIAVANLTSEDIGQVLDTIASFVEKASAYRPPA